MDAAQLPPHSQGLSFISGKPEDPPPKNKGSDQHAAGGTASDQEGDLHAATDPAAAAPTGSCARRQAQAGRQGRRQQGEGAVLVQRGTCHRVCLVCCCEPSNAPGPPEADHCGGHRDPAAARCSKLCLKAFKAAQDKAKEMAELGSPEGLLTDSQARDVQQAGQVFLEEFLPAGDCDVGVVGEQGAAAGSSGHHSSMRSRCSSRRTRCSSHARRW
jgi:hypothetical protein